jgi:hypothetical protein
LAGAWSNTGRVYAFTIAPALALRLRLEADPLKPAGTAQQQSQDNAAECNCGANGQVLPFSSHGLPLKSYYLLLKRRKNWPLAEEPLPAAGGTRMKTDGDRPPGVSDALSWAYWNLKY